MFDPSHIFSYASIQKNRQTPITRLKQTIQNINYHVLDNAGFIKLATVKGRLYHYHQAEYYHQVPDWKLHFSIIDEDLAKAWDIIAELFVNWQCRSIMKMITDNCGDTSWPEAMHGREITIYIYQHSPYYENLMADPTDQLSKKDEHPAKFWFALITTIESALKDHHIRSRGLAKGDQKLGDYASLRNEAYVEYLPKWGEMLPKIEPIIFNGKSYCYPPSIEGLVNGAAHQYPFDPRQIVPPKNIVQSAWRFFRKQVTPLMVRDNDHECALAKIYQAHF